MDLGLGGRLFEGVEIHHHHVYGLDAVFGHGGAMGGVLAAVEYSSMNFGMQGFNATIEHLGKAGELGNILHGDSRVAEEFRRSAG